MKNKPLIISQFFTRTVIALTLLIAITCWVGVTSGQDTAHHESTAEQPDETHAQNHAEHEQDLGQERAQEIAVASPPTWYHTVVWSIAILFILAATLGSAAIILKGPEPPDPADEHH